MTKEEIEAELHLIWQELDHLSKRVRHISLEMTADLIEERRANERRKVGRRT